MNFLLITSLLYLFPSKHKNKRINLMICPNSSLRFSKFEAGIYRKNIHIKREDGEYI